MQTAVRRLEELTLNTSPSLDQSLYDGWVLRASGTDTRRANSVTAVYPSTISLEEKITYCERWYRARMQAAIFRLTDVLSPQGLDEALAQRGYSREVETHVMTAELSALSSAAGSPPDGIRVIERSAQQGVDDLHALKGTRGALMERDLKRQSLWSGEQIFLSAERDGVIVSCGMARRDGDHIGIFGMRTLDALRGIGFATHLVRRLIDWGGQRGARTVFLQVDATNASAIRVYERFGFAPRYRYWHRVQPGKHDD